MELQQTLAQMKQASQLLDQFNQSAENDQNLLLLKTTLAELNNSMSELQQKLNKPA